MTKKYRLKKDLPTFKAGDEFVIRNGSLWAIDKESPEGVICAYAKPTLDKFPNILKDWFEEIPEEPKTVWDLEDGDLYYSIGIRGTIELNTWTSHEVDYDVRNAGNCFLTSENVEKELARRKAKVILERDTKGFKPDWKNSDFGYAVYYDVMREDHRLSCNWDEYIDGSIRFKTEEDAEESIKNHEKEWKIYLGVEEE